MGGMKRVEVGRRVGLRRVGRNEMEVKERKGNCRVSWIVGCNDTRRGGRKGDGTRAGVSKSYMPRSQA